LDALTDGDDGAGEVEVEVDDGAVPLRLAELLEQKTGGCQEPK
jgi:hypothetical protein